jgi:predicted ferric reductase
VNKIQTGILLGTAKQLRLQRGSEAIQLIGLATVLIPILALLADGGASKLESLEQWTALVNRLSALVGTSLLLVHLILVARVPWIESVFGLDRLTGAHKKLGKPLIYVLLLHAITSVAQSAQQNGVDLWVSLVTLVVEYPEMLIAVLGFLLMIVVMLSSISAARQSLSYEVWYLIHLLSYVAVFLAIPHQFAFGSTFLAQPWLSTYFAALYVFTLLNVLWFRSLQPVIRSLTSGFSVASVKATGNSSTSLEIAGTDSAGFVFQSGQFFMVRVMTLKDFWRPHPFSASNSSGEGMLRFTIGNRGDFTNRIQGIKPGTKIVLEGPYGVFTEAKRTMPKVTLIAAGIGVAPIRSLAKQLATKPGDLTILYRSNTENEAALADELSTISKQKGHKMHLLTGPRDKDISWLPVQPARLKGKPDYALLTELAPDIINSDIYICGPTQWTNSLLVTLSKLSIPKNQIHIEEFAW